MILLDAGHGGMDPEMGYTTAPNKMFRHPNFNFFEGEWNRIYMKHLIGLISYHNQVYPLKQIQFKEIAHPIEDTPLLKRIEKVNEIVNSQIDRTIFRNKKRPVCLLISFHFNASPNQRAKGFEIFTSPDQTYSDMVATQYYNEFMKSEYLKEYGMNWRGDWADLDADKEANFRLLTHTNCPAVLVEHGFFDHPEEYKFLIKDKTVIEFAHIHLAVIKWHYESNKLWQHDEGR